MMQEQPQTCSSSSEPVQGNFLCLVPCIHPTQWLQRGLEGDIAFLFDSLKNISNCGIPVSLQPSSRVTLANACDVYAAYSMQIIFLCVLNSTSRRNNPHAEVILALCRASAQTALSIYYVVCATLAFYRGTHNSDPTISHTQVECSETIDAHRIGSNHMAASSPPKEIGHALEGILTQIQALPFFRRHGNRLIGSAYRQMSFLTSVLSLSKSVQVMSDRTLRQQEMRRLLQGMNAMLPLDHCYFPLRSNLSPLSRIIRFKTEACSIFNTRERTLLLLVVELEESNEWLTFDLQHALNNLKPSGTFEAGDTHSRHLRSSSMGCCPRFPSSKQSDGMPNIQNRSEENLCTSNPAFTFSSTQVILKKETTPYPLYANEHTKLKSKDKKEVSSPSVAMLDTMFGPSWERKKQDWIRDEDLDRSSESHNRIAGDEKACPHTLRTRDFNSFLVKRGDNLLQEALAMQLIQLIADMWACENIPLRVRPYHIYVLSQEAGLIEFIHDTITIDSLKKKMNSMVHSRPSTLVHTPASLSEETRAPACNSMTANISSPESSTSQGKCSTLSESTVPGHALNTLMRSPTSGTEIITPTASNSLCSFWHLAYGERTGEPYRTAHRNFIESCAAYSIICYVLQVKDRHNGNILLKRDGSLVHIDFGYMLTTSPGGWNFEDVPFKLPLEYVELMGHDGYNYFKVLFYMGMRCLRDHVDILTCVIAASDAKTLPCLSGDAAAAANAFRERIVGSEDASDDIQFARRVKDMIERSCDSWRTRGYDTFQRIQNGIDH